MSVSTFKAKFKANTGRTFLEYRNDMRIMAAKRLLVQTELKMIDIAQEIGFEDVSLFNRTFRQWTGMSPASIGRIIFEQVLWQAAGT